MNQREKRLLWLFVGIFLLYAVPFELLPGAWGYLQDHDDEVQVIRRKIQRYERLMENQEEWGEREKSFRVRQGEVMDSLIEGDTSDLVGARMIGVLRNINRRAGTNVKSFGLPEFNTTGEWLFVTQTIRFDMPGKKLHGYVKMLTESSQRFKVLSLDVRARGAKLEGTMKVVGFARRPEGERDEEEARR